MENLYEQPLLTDFYQITTAYAYWKTNKHNDFAVYDLFFQKNPFQGEFVVFAGLNDCVRFIKKFGYSHSDIRYLKEILPPTVEDEFFQFLSTLTANDIVLYAVNEGTVVFPRVPLMRIEGPLAVVQLLETIFLNIVNYASLIATNAARYRLAAGNSDLVEFGLRKAQGPHGRLFTSKYAYIGGFDKTSNVLAGKLFDIPLIGIDTRTYITSFAGFEDLKTKTLRLKDGDTVRDLLELATNWREQLTPLFRVIAEEVSDGELAAFIAYAIAFPDKFTVLVDTYDFVKSGLINFSSVALALNDLGYKAMGVTMNSVNFSQLSGMVSKYFSEISVKYDVPWFKNVRITVAKDANEGSITDMSNGKLKIDCFGINSHLIACQPDFGCIYKLVELNKQPRMSFNRDSDKVTIPGRKEIYRLYDKEGYAFMDLIQNWEEEPPVIGRKVLCRHPFVEAKRAYATPCKIEKLYDIYWQEGMTNKHVPTMQEIRTNVTKSIKTLRFDMKRKSNPSQYKVSVSDNLFKFFHAVWLKNAPINELS